MDVIFECYNLQILVDNDLITKFCNWHDHFIMLDLFFK
jgi:hypothetical protein